MLRSFLSPSLLSTRSAASSPELADATCLAVACPACLTLELAQCCSEYVTTLVNGADIVPTFCSGSIDALREDVTRSSWFAGARRAWRRCSGGAGPGLAGPVKTCGAGRAAPPAAVAAVRPPCSKQAAEPAAPRPPARPAEFQRDVRQRMYRALEGSMGVVSRPARPPGPAAPGCRAVDGAPGCRDGAGPPVRSLLPGVCPHLPSPGSLPLLPPPTTSLLLLPPPQVGTATSWTAQNILAPAASPFRSCISARVPAAAEQAPGGRGERSEPGLLQPLLQPGAGSGQASSSGVDAERMQHAMVHVAAAAAAAAAASGSPDEPNQVHAPSAEAADRGPSVPALRPITIAAGAEQGQQPGSAALRRRAFPPPASPTPHSTSGGGSASASAAAGAAAAAPDPSSSSSSAAAGGWRQLGSRISTISVQTVGRSSFSAGSWLIRGMFNACAAPRRPGGGPPGALPAPATPGSSRGMQHSASVQSLQELQQQLEAEPEEDEDDEEVVEEGGAGAGELADGPRGRWMPAVGCWLPDAARWLMADGCWPPAAGSARHR
jgi:hypothetical protein